MRNFRGAVNLGLALGFACVVTLGVLIAATEPPPPGLMGSPRRPANRPALQRPPLRSRMTVRFGILTAALWLSR